MADNLQKCTEIKPPPGQFKSKAWTHFGLFTLKGKAELDMLKAISKLCHAHATYCGNTTNITAHLSLHHPEVNAELVANKRMATASQQTLKAALYKLPSSSEKAKRITKLIADFICKDFVSNIHLLTK